MLGFLVGTTWQQRWSALSSLRGEPVWRRRSSILTFTAVCILAGTARQAAFAQGGSVPVRTSFITSRYISSGTSTPVARLAPLSPVRAIPTAGKSRPVPLSVDSRLTAESTDTDTLAERRNRHALVGMVVGAVAGASIGLAWAKLSCHESSEGPPCELGTRTNMVLCGVIGLIAGGVIGRYADRGAPEHDRTNRLVIGAAPAGAHALVVAVSFR
jgi:hypothetical protein